MGNLGRFLTVFSIVAGVLLAGPPGKEGLSMGEEVSFSAKPIFVLLYHPYEEGFEPAFRSHLQWLKENGYETVSLETLIDYLAGESVFLPEKPILLTFDDGTLEDHTLVYPLLREFGYTGVAFVITDHSFIKTSKKSWWREVDRAGTLRIESHSDSHGLVWLGPEIVDFYSGEVSDLYPLVKGFDPGLGAPIYEYGYELVSERYFPDRRIAHVCVEYVAERGGKDFLEQEEWEEELYRLVEGFRNDHRERGRQESPLQRERRLKKELYGSKGKIERMIGQGKEVLFFAYPWGVHDEGLILELKKYGYRGALTIDDGENYPGDDPFRIRRITITSRMTAEDIASILTSPTR